VALAQDGLHIGGRDLHPVRGTEAARPHLCRREEGAEARWALADAGLPAAAARVQDRRPPIAENLYTEELLRAAFADLEILALVSRDDEIQEGRGHAGMSALIDLVAREPAT
jgi:hypothetical protein